MTPSEFLRDVVAPNAKDLEQEPTNIRHAYNLVAAVDSLAAHIFEWCRDNNSSQVSAFKDDLAYRQHLASRDSDFGLLRDLAKAQKHARLSRGTPRVTSAKQVEVKGRGFGQGPFGEGRYGGPPEVVVTTDSGSVRVVASVARKALDLLEREMKSAGIT